MFCAAPKNKQRTHLRVAAGSAAHAPSPFSACLTSTTAVALFSRVGIELHLRVSARVRKFALNAGQFADTTERRVFV